MNTIRKILLAAILAATTVLSYAQQRPAGMPDTVYAEAQKNHVQGIAVDLEKGYVYFSFTTSFLKTDLQGRPVGSIDRIQGHLGAMTLNPEDGMVYASLECKDDAIGKGIASTLGVGLAAQSTFYIAIIDVDKVTRMGMDPENDPVLRTACIKDACEDYTAKVVTGGKEREHRYGCSGIDGITYAPKPGSRKDGKGLIYVAYGIYRDVDRTDNDYQVILTYNPKTLKQTARTVEFGTLHTEGPSKPLGRYYVYTGNTDWGVQNMMYDPYTRNVFMAVYKGKKPQFANYSLMSFDVAQKPFKARLKGCDYDTALKMQLSTSDLGLRDEPTGLCGWNFKYGSTGMSALGDGWYVFSENGKSDRGNQCCTARLYRWTGDPSAPFVPAK